MIARSLALAGLAIASACRASDTPPPGSRAAVAVALGDSVAYENELTSGVLRRVVVRTPGHTDTLPGILVDAPPVVVGDSVVYGIRAEENLVAGLFAFDVRTRRTRRLPPPPDWVPHAVPRLSPDGRHLAYLAQDSAGRGYGVVATVPEGRVVHRGPPATMLETDAGVDAIAWDGPTRFEIRIDLSYRTGGTQRARGSLAPMTVVVDTLRPAPAR